MNKIQGFCGDIKFGFYWNETQRTEDDYFVIGEFQIFINNQPLLEYKQSEVINEVLPETKRSTVKTSDGEILTLVSNPEISNRGYYINFIIRFLKDNIVELKKQQITCSDEQKDTLYMNSYRYRRYWTYIEDIYHDNAVKELADDDPKIDEIFEEIEERLNQYELNNSFGLELEVYPDISDQGWRFFLFQNSSQTKDRLIYSKDNGKNVFEVQLELGTVARVLSELPDL